MSKIKNKKILTMNASGEEILGKVKEATEQEGFIMNLLLFRLRQFKPEAKGKSINIDTALMSDAKRTKQLLTMKNKLCL